MGSISNSSISFPEREAESIFPEVPDVWGGMGVTEAALKVTYPTPHTQ